MKDTDSLAHTTWNCKYYTVFAPKYRRNLIKKYEAFYSQLYSQHVIIILVGNKSWVKEHTNGY